MVKEIKLCECGCGREVTKPGNRFIHGHTWKNRTLFEETKKKLSEGRKGKNNPFYGRTHSEEAKKKVSEAKKGNTIWKGRVHTEEHKKRCLN